MLLSHYCCQAAQLPETTHFAAQQIRGHTQMRGLCSKVAYRAIVHAEKHVVRPTCRAKYENRTILRTEVGETAVKRGWHITEQDHLNVRTTPC